MTLKISNDINIFLEKIQSLSNKLLRDIRKSGINNLSSQVYLQQFKDYKYQIILKQPIKRLLSSKIFDLLQEQEIRQFQGKQKLQKAPQQIFTDQSLKLVIKRQLTRIQIQQTNFKQIFHKVSALEHQILNYEMEEFKQHNLTKIAKMDIIFEILQNIIIGLETHIQNVQNMGCSRLIQSTNSHSIATITNQNICQNDKSQIKLLKQSKRDNTKLIVEQKCLTSTFEFAQKQISKSKNTTMKPCVDCLLF